MLALFALFRLMESRSVVELFVRFRENGKDVAARHRPNFTNPLRQGGGRAEVDARIGV
jgi:hypothetical protein